MAVYPELFVLEEFESTLAQAPAAARPLVLDEIRRFAERQPLFSPDAMDIVLAYLRTEPDVSGPDLDAELQARDVAVEVWGRIYWVCHTVIGESRLSFEGCFFGLDPLFENIRFLAAAPFKNATFPGAVTFVGCHFEAQGRKEHRLPREQDQVTLLGGASVRRVLLWESTWPTRMVLDGLAASGGEVLIRDCGGVDLEVRGVAARRLRVIGGHFNALSVSDPALESRIVMRRLYASAIRLHDVRMAGSILVSRCQLDDLEVSGVILAATASDERASLEVHRCRVDTLALSHSTVSGDLRLAGTRAASSAWIDVSAESLALDGFSVGGPGVDEPWTVESVSLGLPPLGLLDPLSSMPSSAFATTWGEVWPTLGEAER
ncbi:pentapeptide repeat-containing protein [Demequina sp. SYSU T00068]|uniref:pentapeptide repeat-containing protein n=1 Tax=Demequina lignilytica TaxID=3051663 RepID=UPI002636C8FB|nr:pentapeptide repeat-containing protein [Demequina sp. SYSU T00068]MDN4489692.1 pentapeptide repeat-containing protein [Demequina sp. SYSU T00068]